MNIDDLTIGQAKELTKIFGANSDSSGLNHSIGKKCIVRTYNAGVWFGTIYQKSGKEVIVGDARRMYRWWAAESISLSAVALHGLNLEKSKICEAVESIWLEAVEIIPCTKKSIDSIEAAENVKAT